MTNDEFQKALATINAAFKSGLVEYQYGEYWNKKQINDSVLTIDGVYRIREKPVELWLRKGMCMSRDDIRDEPPAQYDPASWLHLREVLE